MTKDKFTEPVNLYLDKEITECGLAQLKSELAANAERKDDFAESCRMHLAMRMALNPRSPKRSYEFWRNDSNSFSPSSHKVTTFPRWIMGIGFAASLALGFALLMPVFRETPAVSSQPPLKAWRWKICLKMICLTVLVTKKFGALPMCKLSARPINKLV